MAQVLEGGRSLVLWVLRAPQVGRTGWLVGWLVGWLAGWADWLAGWLAGPSVGRSMGNLLNVGAHPPFRTMLQNKAFLVEWLARNTKHGPDIIAFAGVGIAESMFAYWGTWA